ncbi:MAG: hypothetical protein AAFY11_07210 [Cyanobacteria bacterium J06641_5]
MQQDGVGWTEAEKVVARVAFEKAYERETQALVEEVRTKAGKIADLDEVWQLHDYLSARRHDIDGKYDYRYSSLVFVFAQLLREKWLQLEDLKGLEENRLAKISALSRM